MNEGKEAFEVDVDTHLSRMKPTHAHWVIGLYNKLRNSRALIQRGFEVSAIKTGGLGSAVKESSDNNK